MDKLRRADRRKPAKEPTDLGSIIALMTQTRRDEILSKIVTKRRPA